jgi:hypothetical protein
MSTPHYLVCLISSKITTFHAKGKVELTTTLESHMSQRNVCVLCLVSIRELFMCPRTKRMMITIMLLDPFIKSKSWVTLVWNGG